MATQGRVSARHDFQISTCHTQSGVVAIADGAEKVARAIRTVHKEPVQETTRAQGRAGGA
jgi:hypothetical protein